MCVIRRHFLGSEDIAGGFDLSAGGTFFREIQKPFPWVLAVRWRNHYFARNKEAFPWVLPWTRKKSGGGSGDPRRRRRLGGRWWCWGT